MEIRGWSLCSGEDGQFKLELGDHFDRNLHSFAKKLLNENGRFISVKSMTDEKDEYIEFIISLIEQGKITPVIERIFPINEIIEAHVLVDSGRKKGNVVIKIGE